MTAGGDAPRLVLWDIDQTLIEAGTVGRAAYATAFARVTGQELNHPWQFDGRTELAAASDVLRLHGFAAEGALLADFIGDIVAEAHRRADELAATAILLSGAAQARRAVGAVPGVLQSVLTGNLYPLAVLKLAAFGLSEHLDLRVGAYGGDAFDRCDLPRHALARAENLLGHRYQPRDVTIIGDTCRDVEAALTVGARAVAVATGTTPAHELAAAGATVVLDDLTDTKAVVEAVLGSIRPARSPIPWPRT